MSVTRRPSSIHQTQHTLSNRARERGKKNRERETEYDGNENQKQNVKVHQPILLSDFRTDHVSKQSRRVGTRIQAEGPVEHGGRSRRLSAGPLQGHRGNLLALGQPNTRVLEKAK
ncbi:predicted protein [Histoplasma capsulatum var. duboisii H88]|uniref:Predicted protein n=2 Tax=Ajellomyces capsulatus TaxID=5037 RepID=F0U8Z4_AJEC8|nr:predicted protein [Histoplasma capsulatum H143]EGC40996.1 predicted protein [Histoplasma capsulatum var. duboisii H88]